MFCGQILWDYVQFHRLTWYFFTPSRPHWEWETSVGVTWFIRQISFYVCVWWVICVPEWSTFVIWGDGTMWNSLVEKTGDASSCFWSPFPGEIENTPNRSWLVLAVLNCMAPFFLPLAFVFTQRVQKRKFQSSNIVRTTLLVLRKCCGQLGHEPRKQE